MTARKQPLRALLRSRGYVRHGVRLNEVSGQYVANAYEHEWPSVTVRAPTKRAALAGLVAVLEALPAVKARKG